MFIPSFDIIIDYKKSRSQDAKKIFFINKSNEIGFCEIRHRYYIIY